MMGEVCTLVLFIVKVKYPSTYIIIDASELFMETPRYQSLPHEVTISSTALLSIS